MPQRVLIVDDNESLAATVADILSESGFEVEVASSGAQALVAWRSRPADLVVVDVDLPDIGGLTVARRLLRRSAALVVTSARDPERLIPMCEQLGAVFLAKPFSLSHLVATIRLLFERRGWREALAAPEGRPPSRLLGPRKPRALLQH